MGDHPQAHDWGERLYVPGNSLVHRLPAHAKLLSAFGTVLIVVLTPATWWSAFLGYLLLVVALMGLARLRPSTVLPRMAVELPFVVFALLMPFVGRDPQVAVGPLELSEPGLWAMWNILAKATICVAISLVLAATTPTRDLVAGLRKLRLPDLLVQIQTAMIRYVHVVTAEQRRMMLAMSARGYDARSPRAWPVLAKSLGALFIRSYERGERVHAAMLSRGYTGAMPVLVAESTGRVAWPAVVLPAAAAAVAGINAAWFLGAAG